MENSGAGLVGMMKTKIVMDMVGQINAPISGYEVHIVDNEDLEGLTEEEDIIEYLFTKVPVDKDWHVRYGNEDHFIDWSEIMITKTPLKLNPGSDPLFDESEIPESWLLREETL